jgi:hypothetical protein
MDTFSVLNGISLITRSHYLGYAIKHASRAPSVARLASEEQARFADSRASGVISPPLATGSPGRSPRITSGGELPGYFPVASPLSFKDQRKRFGSFDSEMKSPESPHQRFLFRACSLASFSGTSGRADGFPFLSFSTGQVFHRRVCANNRNLTWLLRKMTGGWRVFLVLMKLVGYPRAIVLRYSCRKRIWISDLRDLGLKTISTSVDDVLWRPQHSF